MTLAAQLQYIGYCLIFIFLACVVAMVVSRIRRGPEEPAPEEVPHEGVGLDEATVQFIADLHRDAAPPTDVMAPHPLGPPTLEEHWAAEDAWWAATYAELTGRAQQDWRYRLDRDVARALDAEFAATVRSIERELADQTTEFMHLVDCALEETSEIPMGVPA